MHGPQILVWKGLWVFNYKEKNENFMINILVYSIDKNYFLTVILVFEWLKLCIFKLKIYNMKHKIINNSYFILTRWKIKPNG